jgi:hypothetical protein
MAVSGPSPEVTVKIRKVPNDISRAVVLANCFHAGSLFGLLFDSEDGSDMFLRNVGCLSMDYIEIYPIR